MCFHFSSFTSASKYILLFYVQFKNKSNAKLYPTRRVRLTMHNTSKKRNLRQLFYF